jgi:hypothetical protein
VKKKPNWQFLCLIYIEIFLPYLIARFVMKVGIERTARIMRTGASLAINGYQVQTARRSTPQPDPAASIDGVFHL